MKNCTCTKTGLSTICICKYFLHSLLDDCSSEGASNVPTSQLRIMPMATLALVSLINNPHIAQIINNKYDEAQNWEEERVPYYYLSVRRNAFHILM